jgi:hypothetical protein
MLACVGVMAAVACGGGAGKEGAVVPKTTAALSSEQIDKDPLILFPSNAIAIGTLDAKAFYASKTLGPEVAKLAEQYSPIGAEAGFSASKDLDRITFASYSLSGVDVLAVLSGRFDGTKLAQLAKTHGAAKSGSPIVESTYGGRTLYTVDNVGFAILTDKIVLAGTETAIRRAIDRIHDARGHRDVFPWMLEVVETAGAVLAIAGDFKNQPLSGAAVQGMHIPATDGLTAARVLGTFQEPGMQLAGSLTYDSEANAQKGQAGFDKVVLMYRAYAGMSGTLPQLRDVTTTVEKTDVQVKFSIDDQSLRTFLSKVPQLFPPPR